MAQRALLSGDSRELSLRIHRPLIPMPYRTAEEMKKSEEVAWEGAWLSFRTSPARAIQSAC